MFHFLNFNIYTLSLLTTRQLFKMFLNIIWQNLQYFQLLSYLYLKTKSLQFQKNLPQSKRKTSLVFIFITGAHLPFRHLVSNLEMEIVLPFRQHPNLLLPLVRNTRQRTVPLFYVDVGRTFRNYVPRQDTPEKE